MWIKVSDIIKCMFVFQIVTPFPRVGVQKICCRCISLLFSSFIVLCKQIAQPYSFGRYWTPKVNSLRYSGRPECYNFRLQNHELYSHKQSAACQNNIEVLFCLKCLFTILFNKSNLCCPWWPLCGITWFAEEVCLINS